MDRRWPRGLLYLCWLLLLIGLGVRVWRDPSFAGLYDQELDGLLYSGQRLLRGGLLYADHFLPVQPIAQYLYVPSAWLGSLRAHRLLIFLVDLAAAVLLVPSLRRLAAAGLMPLAPGSVVAPMAGVLFLVLSQMLRGGAAGHLEHFANLFLVVALFVLSGSLRSGQGPGRGAGGAGNLAPLPAGAALFLAFDCFPALLTPILLGVALVLVRSRRWLPELGMLLLGGALAAVLVFLPYLWIPGGPALAFAGALLVPLQWTGRMPADVSELPLASAALLRASVAGVPVWLLGVVPALGLVRLVRRQWRAPVAGSDRPLFLPGLAVILLVEMGWSVRTEPGQSHPLLLLVLPLLLLIAAGLADLEGQARRGWRGLAVTSLLVFSLLFLNNIFVPAVFGTPRQPSGLVAELEADRALVRGYLRDLAPAERGFTAPQDTALQWQMGVKASTRGIGPSWSLNQQELRQTWATRRLGLPTDVPGSCAQLTAPANRQLVWRRTDPEGPNTLAFLTGCLSAGGGQWQDVSDALKLRTGQMRVFRRIAS
jgi:hypothetical protein